MGGEGSDRTGVCAVARGTFLHGWALAMQGQGEAGLAAMRQGLAADLATGSTLYQPYYLGLLAGAYGACGHPEEGLTALAQEYAEQRTGFFTTNVAEAGAFLRIDPGQTIPNMQCFFYPTC
jgi:hypothetical protein